MPSRLASLGLAAVLVASLTACTPTPEPTPTPTGFSTEEEAFAAAEETFELYIAATNGIRIDDPDTFEPMFAVTIANANANQRENLSQMHAVQWTVTGETVLVRFEPEAFDSAVQEVTALACVDVSAVEVVDVAGDSVVSESRPDRQLIAVTLGLTDKTETGLAVARSDRRSDGCEA